MDTIKKCMGLVLVYMSASDIYDTYDSDIESTRRLASELNKLKEIVLANSIVESGDILLKKQINYNEIYPFGYSPEYDSKVKAVLRNVVKWTHVFAGSPGGSISSMNISKSSATEIVNRTLLFIVTIEQYLNNRANIERWKKHGGLHKAIRSKEYLRH